MRPDCVPGADLIQRGLDDLERGAITAASLLVSSGAPRLSRLGVRVPAPLPAAEHRLYELLAEAAPTRRTLATTH